MQVAHLSRGVLPTGIPGPRGLPIVGNALTFGQDPLGSLTRWAREYGDIFCVRAGIPFIYINHPDDIESVLLDKEHTYIKATERFPQRAFVRMVFGQGMLFSEGDVWRRQRRLAAPAFHHRRIALYGEVMADYADRHIRRWRDGEVRNFHGDMMRVTLAIVAKTLFDADVEDDAQDVGEALDAIMETTASRIGQPLLQLPLGVPTPGNRRFLSAIRQLDAIIYRLIGERRAEGRDTGDLLSMLLQARDEDGSGMSDQVLRDELLTLFLAGHETTALTLSWAYYLLSQYPDVLARLEAELDGVLGGRLPCVADLPQLPYTEQVIKETLRLFPPTWMISPRLAQRDVVVRGFTLPKGSVLAIAPWIVHRDERFFPNPECFDPDRWLPERSQSLPRHAYIPFSGGPRICIGNSFAMMETVLLLATISQRFRLPLLPGQQIVPQPSMTVRPKYGLLVQVDARS